MTLVEINRDTKEGKLLWAALIVMTTLPHEINFLNCSKKGTELEPDEALRLLKEASDFIEDKYHD